MRAETVLQRDLRNYLALRGCRSVHVPNGSVLRGDKVDRAKQMASLKRAGLVPGFPDLIVYRKGGLVGHMEVKTDKGRQEASQVECQRWLTEFGQNYAIVRSTEDVDAALSAWGWI